MTPEQFKTTALELCDSVSRMWVVSGDNKRLVRGLRAALTSDRGDQIAALVSPYIQDSRGKREPRRGIGFDPARLSGDTGPVSGQVLLMTMYGGGVVALIVAPDAGENAQPAWFFIDKTSKITIDGKAGDGAAARAAFDAAGGGMHVKADVETDAENNPTAKTAELTSGAPDPTPPGPGPVPPPDPTPPDPPGPGPTPPDPTPPGPLPDPTPPDWRDA